MRELLQQFRLRRLMGVVALDAVGGSERLSLVRLDERRILDVVAVDAECGHSLGQMLVELELAHLAHLVGDVAGVASHIERGVAAAFFPGGRLEQLKLVIRLVGIMALDAIAHCRGMHGPFQRGGVFICVTSKAEGLRSRRDELDSGYVFVDPNFVATCAAHLDGGVDGLALGLIFVALQTCLRVGIRLQRDWMDGTEKRRAEQQKAQGEKDTCPQRLPRRTWARSNAYARLRELM